MLFWVISSIASGILSNLAGSWFVNTKLGNWFYDKSDDVSLWASKKLGLRILQDEETWKKKYPNVSKKLDELEAKINTIVDEIRKGVNR